MEVRVLSAAPYSLPRTWALLFAFRKNQTLTYTYDPVGNRLSSLGVSSYNNNASNELTSTPSTTYTYDNNGNLLTKVVGSNTTSYSWDFENRLNSVTLPGSGGTVNFKYDPWGRRIYKSSSSGTSIYAYDQDNLVEEVNSTGAAVARYSDGTNVDEPLAELRSGTTSYYEADGLGSVTSLSNSAGSLAQTYTFDSFGNLIASSGSIVNNFRYTGREFDAEANLYFYRFRYYDSAAGRFISEDPIMFLGGYNFYSYVANAAPTYIDPFGLDKLCNIPAPAPPGPHHLVPTPITTCGTQPLIDCIIQAESSGNPKAKSNKGASGAMQVTPGVSKELGKHGFDVGNMTNVQLGTTYINLLLTYCSNTAVALAAYNAGPGAVNSWGSIPEFDETHNYLKRINTCLQKKGLQGGIQDPGATSFCGCQQ